MKLLRANLYVKIVLWVLLNLVLLAALAFGFGWYAVTEKGSDGVLPASLFSSRSDSALRVVSANLQYRAVTEWEDLLKPHAGRLPVKIHIRTLDTASIYNDTIPDKMVKQARALPRATYTFCPEPDVVFWDTMGSSDPGAVLNVEYGLPPVPPALFHRSSDPARWWLGRVMYIPDHNRQVHTVLIALESDRMDGYGLFFDVKALCLLVFGVLGVSFLWWIPFVRHLSRPLRRMARYAEEVEADSFSCVEKPVLQEKEFSGERRDEVGRLGFALSSMTRRMNRMVTGQSQFIRHVAHELNMPLAKAEMGLGVLELRLSGDEQERVRQVMGHIERISSLTDEVLSYLQAKASMGTPQAEPVDLCAFLSTLVQDKAPDEDVHVLVEQGLCLWTDRQFLQRAVGNLIRNALRYAGDAGPVIVRAGSLPEGGVCISVSDMGPGVAEEDMPTLLEPFYRGRAAASHPGGTGLGLSIVKYCMDACGGRVVYGNRPEGGFEVKLLFPPRRRPGE